MQLHDLKIKTRGKKRIGRGGKRGTYSGKGMKGQKSRAGHKIRPESRDLLIRIPKLKGIKNKPLAPKTIAINLFKIAKIKENTITREVLITNKILRKKENNIKILSIGTIDRPITIKGIPVSKKVKEKIEAAGGKIIA